MKEKLTVSGKRKSSVAKATIQPGTGKVKINKIPYELLPNLRKIMIQEPIELAKEVLGKLDYDISVVVKGGGVNSQTESSRLAIAKAILEITNSKELKEKFLSYDRTLTVADVRRKEPYKPGDSKARSKRQKSYR
jgi:small subunit ribosomal protein S9